MQNPKGRALIQSQQPQHSGLLSRRSLISQWVFRFALNAGKDLSPEEASAIVSLWVESFADLSDAVLEAAFRKAINACKFWPKVADIREHVERAEENSGAEKAAWEWQKVRTYLRVDYHPDLGTRNGPQFSEQTRRAINAAGGLAYLSECIGRDLVFARERFIEQYIRLEHLKQDQYLLPEGEIRNLFAAAAEKMSVDRLLSNSQK